jgi:diguanylate cyclase (GGDEF)-like protein
MHAHPAPAAPERRRLGGPWIAGAYGLLGLLIVCYWGYLAVRPSGADSTLLNAFVVALEVAGSSLCIARGFSRRSGRAIPLMLGASMLSWSLGDLVLTIEQAGGGEVPTPSVADAFYLAFFPLAYVALALFMRGEVRRLNTPSWLDSAVAALGAAALCAAFAFHELLHSAGGGVPAVATNLAYPVGDLLLLAMVVGSTAMLSGRSRAPWLLLAGGMTLNVAGDTVNLFGSTAGATHLGTVVNAVAWPTSIFLMSIAMWVDPGRADPRVQQKPQGFVLPGIASATSLVILLLDGTVEIGPVARALAGATLLVVGIRLAISVNGLRMVTMERQHQSITDHLTGLGNRRYLFEILSAFFAEAADPALEPRLMAFLYIDLDRFKEINDSFGHPAGDDLLRQLGRRLTAVMRPSDALIRLGGDEFAAVLLDADAAVAGEVAARVDECLLAPFEIDGVSVRVGASIGVAMAPADAETGDDLVSCADVAMYRAKVRGESYAFYDSNFDELGNLLHLAEQLREAIETDQLELHYQPQLEVRTGAVLAVEALLRWNHPTLGMVPPLKFVPLAEQAGLMDTLTRWVLGTALAQVGEWRAEGSDVVVSVNVSASNLLGPGFAALVQEALESHDVPAEALVLEITETGIITDFDRASLIVGQLSALGVIVSIDDFGTGFTSLAYLSGLSVGELKLDRTFVADLANPDRERELRLVRSTIELGHSLNLRVVAEGIEDEHTLDLLTELGCDVVQGFYIGKAQPAGDFAFAAAPPAADRAAALAAPVRASLPGAERTSDVLRPSRT